MVLSIELKMLFYSTILGVVQLLIAAQTATAQKGVAWNLSPRDKKGPELEGVAGRMDRAFKNFMETFPFFMAVILMVQITSMANNVTMWGAMIYFWARVLYLPVYAAGIPGLRSLIWLVSLIGIVMVASALF